MTHRGTVAGDAIEDLQTTPSGKVWTSYFDEALGGTGPEGHGLARFNSDLSVDWLYPLSSGLPYISDCYSLNVAGETAYFCPYTDFRILSVADSKVTDWGPSPYRYAHHLLRRGPDLALIKGFGPEYDVATMLRLNRGDQPRMGGQCRVVLPDGMETSSLRHIARGEGLHAFWRSHWYYTDIDGLSAAAVGALPPVSED